MSQAALNKALSDLGFIQCHENDKKDGTHKRSYEYPPSQIVSKVRESYAELESIQRVRALMADHILNIQVAVTQTKAQLRSVLSEI